MKAAGAAMADAPWATGAIRGYARPAAGGEPAQDR